MGGGVLVFLRNANVACLCRLLMPMSHIDFKKCKCFMSLSISVPCRMSLSLISHVDFKKGPCCLVQLRGRGPFISDDIPSKQLSYERNFYEYLLNTN